MKTPSKTLGFSLIESLLGLFIFGLLLFTSNLGLKAFLMQQERYRSLHQLRNVIEYAKQEAINRRQALTLCPSLSTHVCQPTYDWSQGYLLINSATQELIAQFPSKTRYGTLGFRGFANLLILSPQGTTHNMGTFTYCPNNKNAQQADALVINRFLRLYFIKKKNRSGYLLKQANTSKEEPLFCRY